MVFHRSQLFVGEFHCILSSDRYCDCVYHCVIVYPEVLRFVRVPLSLKDSSWPDEALLLNLHRCVKTKRLVCDPIILWSFGGHCATEYYKHRHVGKCCHLLFRVTVLNTHHITPHCHYSLEYTLCLVVFNKNSIQRCVLRTLELSV